MGWEVAGGRATSSVSRRLSQGTLGQGRSPLRGTVSEGILPAAISAPCGSRGPSLSKTPCSP
eukprot:3374989-Pleurochrysis_carterae.AAC.1